MIRFLFSRHRADQGSSEQVDFETVLLDCPEIQERVDRGGRDLGSYDFTRLIGVEVVPDQIADLRAHITTVESLAGRLPKE